MNTHSFHSFSFLLPAHLFFRRVAVLILFVASLLVLQNARAQDANWVGGSGGDPSEWVESANWSPAIIPSGTATFGSTGVLSVANDNGLVTIGAVQFTSVAQAYTISIDNTFIVNGAGVANNSVNTQNFNIFDTLIFQNSSSAGSGSGLVNYSNSGFVYFQDSSTAGSGTFTNNEIFQFSGSSNAGSASFTNNIELDFFDSASAASAAIANKGELTFNNSSTSGSAAITNSGTVQFLNSATAGSATLTTASGGLVTFTGNSTGGQAQFTTNAGGGFDMSGLDSGSMTAGSISGSGNYFLGSKTLIVGDSNLSGTVGGAISDGGISGGTGGALVKNGTGTLALTGSNAYTGGTILNAGALVVGNNYALGTGLFTITGGVLTGSAPSSVTIANNISAQGDFSIAAPQGVFYLTGTMDLNGAPARTITVTDAFDQIYLNGVIANGGLTLSSTYTSGDGGVFWMNSGANTYTGLTIIDHNVTLLLAGNVANQTILGNVLINPGGVLDINSSIQQISGAATVTDNSAGNNTRFGTVGGLWLSGNDVTLGALSGTGSVEMQNQSGTHAGVFTIGSGSFGGTIYDGGQGGQVVKTGTGTLIFGGSNTYSGSTIVNGGALQVDGVIASGTTLVNQGGILRGIGVIGGVLNNFSNVAPGDSPGTLTVTGNYNQMSSGTLTIQVAGIGAGQHGLLTVGGAATLDGKVKFVKLPGLQYKAGQSFIFLTATSGVSGTFAAVDLGTIMGAKVIYDPNDVQLEFQQGSFANFALLSNLTPNQTAVAQDLDIVSQGSGNSALITFLNNEPLGNLPHDFDLIAPEELTAIFQISEAFADVQSNNIENHLASVRAGSPSANNTTVGLLVRSDSVGLRDDSSKDGKDYKGSGPIPADTGSARWNLWSEGSGDLVRVGGDTNAAGYHFTTGGVTLGADYKVNDHFVFGLMGGYANTGATLTQNGSVDVESGRLGIYSTLFGGGFHLDGLATGGYNSYDTHRAALGGVAQGNANSAEFNSLLSGGYDIRAGHFTLGPVASAQYTCVDLQSFNENGSLAPLHFNAQNQDSLRSKIGFRIMSGWDIGGVVVTPGITAAWQHEYLDSAFALDSQFASGAGNTFTVRGPKLGRDSAVVSAGVNVQWTPRLSTYLSYYGELGRKNYEQNSISGGVNLSY